MKPPDLNTLLVFSLVVSFIGKALWDWFKTGRVEKGTYMKIEDCQKSRDKCCVVQLKKDIATHATRLDAVEKRLDQGREDFRALRRDIGEMKEHIAGMRALLERWIDQGSPAA